MADERTVSAANGNIKNLFTGAQEAPAVDGARTPATTNATAPNDNQEKIAEMQRVLLFRIAALKASAGSPMPQAIADQIDLMESALATGNLTVLSLAYTATVAAKNTMEAEKTREASTTAAAIEAIFDSYGLSPAEKMRAFDLCQRIDVNDPASVLRFSEAMVDQSMPPAIRAEQAAQLAIATMNDPVQVAILNAASPTAKAETMAAYVAAQRDFSELEKDPKYASIADTLKRADRMGLEALPEVQELLRKAKAGALSPEELKAGFEPLIEVQKQKYIAEMTDARAQQSPEKQALLATIGEGEEKGSNKAIYELARKTIGELKKNSAYQMSEQERAALNTFALTRDKSIIKILGDDALAKTFELGTGTIEQRTERAMQAVKENMPPELTGMKDEILRERIKQTLLNADERHVAIKNLDTLKGQELASLSAEIGNDMRAALANARFLEANATPAELATGASSVGKNDAQITASTADFLKEIEAKKLAKQNEAAAVAQQSGEVPTSPAAAASPSTNSAESPVAGTTSVVATTSVLPPPGIDPKDIPPLRGVLSGMQPLAAEQQEPKGHLVNKTAAPAQEISGQAY